MTRQREYTYTVTGTGNFPFDMLRYYRAWPRREAEIGKVPFDPRHDDRENRSIDIRSNSSPTTARWRSFGWIVSNIEGYTF